MRTQTNDLIFYVNGFAVCAWKQYGICMGDGFLTTLDEPVGNKEYISNNARGENGIRITSPTKPKKKERDIALVFTIEGETPAEMRSLKNLFFSMMDNQNGQLILKVPELGDNVFRLYYTGNGADYSLSLDRCFCKMALKFKEPDPTDRGEVAEEELEETEQ